MKSIAKTFYYLCNGTGTLMLALAIFEAIKNPPRNFVIFIGMIIVPAVFFGVAHVIKTRSAP